MEKFSKLLVALLDRTERGLVQWQQTADDDAFQYSLPDSTVRITNGGAGVFYISILNGEGRVVDSISNIDLDKSVNFDAFKMAAQLYQAARRHALNADATLDGILIQLGIEA